MKRLALDTSTDLATVALQVDDVVFFEEQRGVREHARTLLPMIERLMHAADLTWSALDDIVFGCGPGSFTGLRITCSVAKALACAHNLDLIPVSSLSAMAWSVLQKKPGASALALMDARMNEVYWSVFELNVESPLYVTSLADIVCDARGDLILVGVGYEPSIETLPISIQSRVVDTVIVYPDAREMLHFAAHHLISPMSAVTAEPLYIRQHITQGERRG